MCTLIFELTCINPNFKNKRERQKERMKERVNERANIENFNVELVSKI